MARRSRNALAPAKKTIGDAQNGVFVSAASAWEIATKHHIGKLPGVAAIIGDLESIILQQGFLHLPISILHGQTAGALPGPHRDSFDRMLIAQAVLEDLVIKSNEPPFDIYGVKRLW